MTTTAIPVLRYKEGSTVVPGDRLGTIRQVRPGTGTYVKGGHVYACLLGRLALHRAEEKTKGRGDDDDGENNGAAMDVDEEDDAPEFFCSIVSSRPPATNQVLRVGQRVIGRISRITPQNALLEIRVAEGVGSLRQPFCCEGAIKLEDVRSFSTTSGGTPSKNENKEAVVLAESFRPGDLVACRIISMGDSRRYFLSTAEIDLGVVRAQRNGVNMVPVSWKEMECPETGIREARKCAKPSVH
eukprot:CAMPEP_0201119746 /NCGR_PEP_ID=MMETSP0850-20130426/3860_1 /ASSEMBLY_ACC=CAM_ASM_000622 /TAXON_ID=183588 /ORGANISM="Pseudo-nitzschia fraudulenta, Strain WWA7" /LENGTH=241 /DNA_ID=CAMNT_0047385591 /DNA_START=48 /DNA_END=773 /DNA_ORIENTATION=+